MAASSLTTSPLNIPRLKVHDLFSVGQEFSPLNVLFAVNSFVPQLPYVRSLRYNQI